MNTCRMEKRIGNGWFGRRPLVILTGLVLVLALSNCDVDEEEEGDVQVPGQVGMNFIRVTHGTFQMGSPADDVGTPADEAEMGRLEDETQHEVTISQDFYLQESEVTQEQWQEIMGNNPSTQSSCPQCPVENVSWNDVQTFIAELSAEDGKTYRLPTEAEWEYAARAGSGTAFANGGISEQNCIDKDTVLDEIGWYCENSEDVSHAVKGKLANGFSFYDMHGNVAEWVQDWYGEYEAGPLTDPTGPASGTNRVARGGGWKSLPPLCRSAARAIYSPSFQGSDLGFRLVWEP